MNDNLLMWNLLVGFALPHLIAVLQQPGWSKKSRMLVTLVVCVIGGALAAYFNGELADTSELVTSILTVLVAAVSFYRNLWKATGIPQAIESTTSPREPDLSHLTDDE